MKINGIIKPLKESNQYENIILGIKNNKLPLEINGISDSSKSYVLSTLFNDINKNVLILTHNDIEARNLYEDLLFYTSSVLYFPTREMVFYNIYAVSGDLRWERLKGIRQILQAKKKIIITTVDALAAAYTPVDLFKKYIFKLRVGEVIDLKDIINKFIQAGYDRVASVENKGQFCLKGGIIDIYPPNQELPYRIELFDDEIDSIRTFNIQTQRSIEKVSKIEIIPAKEIILTQQNIDMGYQRINEDLNKTVNNLKNINDKQQLKSLKNSISQKLETLKETWNFENIESFLPYFYDSTSTLLDYISDPFIILDESKRCFGKLDSVYFQFQEDYKNFYERAGVLLAQSKLLYPKDYIVDILKTRCSIVIQSLSNSSDLISTSLKIDIGGKTLSNYHGQLDMLIKDISNKKQQKYRTVILSGTKARGKRLVNTLRDREIESVYKENIDEINPGEIIITSGSLLNGFEFENLKLCIISDKEVFGESKRKLKNRSKKKKGVGKIKSFSELKLGDYVVHENHGIGIYRGIKQLNVEGHKKDYLEIEYGNNDKLYVPVENLDLIQKYIGSEGNAPRINKLGGNEWNKTKRKVRQSINNIAQELVKLYAIRSTIKGVKYSKDTVWQKQFEDEFEFEETPDQLTAIEEIKKDLESDRPMDRLLCGDVGYGKTEVAVRAAFKVIMDGKQVAFLVPTTILAAQHYNNFIKRFSDFPIKIEMISRFRTPAQQKKILKDLKNGDIDILIGTHRILQKDVKFKDLGLLIVDEEQRFGVKHKEAIKNIKKNVDVLTLTATPIPRTLHMSLTGVKDISVIETPPEERYPIQTYVVEFNEQLVRDAVIKELSRDGQIYFLFNRVKDIKEMASYLSKLIPEAKIGIAHGQMTERELEKVMISFMNKEFNVLVCTTIIETGIDIQNVNTIIIYDADKMGLSQLYQLRGRVGRANKIAYAYLMYKKDKVLSEVAEKRLKAIKDFTELGSGFKIAMKDLEIRGAGNMMGSAQHGHMAAVGYDLYCRMLEDEIKKIKGEIEEQPIETDIKLDVDAYIPNTYIEDEVQKIEIYKKIASIESYDEMMDVQEEIEDRFSDIPECVNNLIIISYLRSVASRIGVEEIKSKENGFSLKLASSKYINEEFVKTILDKYDNKIVFNMSDKPVLTYILPKNNKQKLVYVLKDMLECMSKIIEKK